MSNPVFKYLHTHRNPSDRTLFNASIGATKQYESSDSLRLPIPATVEASISDLLLQRHSCRQMSGGAVSIPNISSILYWSMSELPYQNTNGNSESDFRRRPYPSGGAKYPLDAYLLTDTHKELGSALYHYRPDIHALETVKDITPKEIDLIKNSYVYDFVADIPVMVIFTYIMERNVPKYGTFGAKLALIEAGHIGQNIATIAQAVNVGSIMLAGGDFERMDALFGFDSYNESTFYTVGLGKQAEVNYKKE